MFPLHSILAAQNIVPLLGPIAAAVCAVILLIAFSGGFAKGFRRVRWGGLVWLTASLAFILLYKFVGGMVYGFGLVGMVGYALACVLASLAFYGVLATLVRPSMKWVKNTVNGDDSLAEYGLEFEPEYLEFDNENDPAPYGKILQKTGYEPPSVAGRLLGGLTCMINCAMALFGVFAFVFIMLGTTRMSTGYLGVLLTAPFLKIFFNVVVDYALDIFTMGLVLYIAFKGYEKGFLASLLSFIVKGGKAIAIVLCLYLPFSKYAYATDGLFFFVAKLTQNAYNVFDKLGELLGSIAARLFTGLLLTVFAIIVFALLNALVNRCSGCIESIRLTRKVDGCLSVVLYAVIGALVCVAIWFVLGALDLCDIIMIRKAIGANAKLSNTLLAFTKNILNGVLAPFIG